MDWSKCYEKHGKTMFFFFLDEVSAISMFILWKRHLGAAVGINIVPAIGRYIISVPSRMA